MNREQAINLADDNCYGDYEGNALGVDDVINTIYDDFESRTCGNCAVMDCPILHTLANAGTIRLVDFGCTEFVRID